MRSEAPQLALCAAPHRRMRPPQKTFERLPSLTLILPCSQLRKALERDLKGRQLAPPPLHGAIPMLSHSPGRVHDQHVQTPLPLGLAPPEASGMHGHKEEQELHSAACQARPSHAMKQGVMRWTISKTSGLNAYTLDG
jgi:hypothetical protein